MRPSIESLWKMIRNRQVKCLVENLGIEIESIEVDSIRGTMPVDSRTTQYFGVLHGGASVALAETLASIGALVHIDQEKEIVVGLEINANHLRSVKSGKITGLAKPVHLGRKTQVWSIELNNEEGKLVCLSRCTLAVIPKPPETT
jgi:1,4-dihydroxy-2-naphthoyl-CoA hydrolase